MKNSLIFILGALLGLAVCVLYSQFSGKEDSPALSESVPSPSDSSFGIFQEIPKVELLRGPREVRLLNDFSFTDSKGATWEVKSGSIVDGASIPKSVWSLVGSPLVGNYRYASIIHDAFYKAKNCNDAEDGCKKTDKTWKSIHRVFYDGMRAQGVPALKAAVMYAAVVTYGRIVEGAEESGGEELSEEELISISKKLEAASKSNTNITPDEIDKILGL